MDLRPIDDIENRRRAVSEPGASATLFGLSSPQRARFFKGVPMALRSTNGDEKLAVEPDDASRAATARERTIRQMFGCFSTEYPWTCGPPMVMKNSLPSRTTASRAATARERTIRQIFGCFSRERLYATSLPSNRRVQRRYVRAR